MRGLFKGLKGESPSASETMSKKNFEKSDEEMSPEDSSRAEDYLSKLANSVLNKERMDYKQRVQGKDRRPVVPGQTPNPAPFRPSGEATPRPTNPQRQSSGEGFPKPTSSQTDIPVPPSARTPMPVRRTPLPVSQGTPAPAAATPTPRRRSDTREGHFVGTDGTFAVGTILYLEDKSIGIYKDKRTDKDYEVIYLLLPDGRVTAQGIALENYDLKVLGLMPPEFMIRLQRRQRWDRDELIFHLDTFDYCALIPHPTTDTIEFNTPRPATPRSAPESEPRKLVTGRHFSINFGDREWGAVFWGEDELGPVVAHNTHEKWSIMHLDLNRFRDSLKLGEMADAALLKKIRDDISGG